jgi:hypothetical protein
MLYSLESAGLHLNTQGAARSTLVTSQHSGNHAACFYQHAPQHVKVSIGSECAAFARSGLKWALEEALHQTPRQGA